MERIRLDAIAFDAGTQVRAAINEDVVADYADKMTDGVEFPPIVLFHDGTARYLADGFHRYMAAKRNAFVDIEADVRAGTKTDALWFALGANKANGARMTDADKKHAIGLALQMFPDRSMRQIADHVGCSSTYASRVRGEVEVRTGLQPVTRVVGVDGVSYPASRTAREDARANAERLLREGRTVEEVRSETGIGRDAALQIRRDVGSGVDKSRDAVAQRRKDISDLATRGFSTPQIAANLNITEGGVKEIARKEGIVIHADSIVGKTRRIDADRVVRQSVIQLEGLVSDLSDVSIGDLDADQLPVWTAALKGAHKSIGAFIRRLEQEQKQHVEAAS
jgi:ParB-like chromosome segregation protein Spo0J